MSLGVFLVLYNLFISVWKHFGGSYLNCVISVTCVITSDLKIPSVYWVQGYNTDLMLGPRL